MARSRVDFTLTTKLEMPCRMYLSFILKIHFFVAPINFNHILYIQNVAIRPIFFLHTIL
jgi:hypothetical protein